MDFLSFLPGDNQDLAAAQVIELINQDIGQLLRLPPQHFWQVVVTDKSLHTCLDSFLRFRRRCFDESPEAMQGSSDLLLQLSQRVFKVFWRMVHPQEPSSSTSSSSSSTSGPPKGPAAPAAAGASKSPPSPQQVGELLYNQWLLDVPKMMDLAVLYGPGSSQLAGQLLQALMLLQPKYAKDILTLAEPLSGNLHEVGETVKHLAGRVLKAGPASAPAAATDLQELSEAVRYFTDAFLTLQAFVQCMPAAAALLLHPANHGSLLLVLAVVHSSVLPQLLRLAQQPGAAELSGQGVTPGRVLQLQKCLVSLVYHLLASAFCTEAGAAASGGPDAIAAQAAAAGGSSSSKKAPPGFGSHSSSSSNGAKGLGFSPEVQGQELMNLLMLLAHPSDHVHQQQGAAAADGGLRGSLLAALNQAHHFDVTVAAAMQQGLLALDDAQFDYLLALVDGDRQLLQQRQQHALAAPPASQQPANPAAATSSSTSISTASHTQLPPPGVLAEQISSIRELLPDYGDGFLTAVLFHNGFSSEQAINCLLEGSLPQQLQGLDPGLATWSPPSSSSSSSRSTSQQQQQRPSAGSSSSSAQASSCSDAGLSWTVLAKEAAAVAAATPSVAPVPLPSLMQAAAASGPKPAVDRRTGRVLGALPGEVRSLTKNIAYELQYEYDDEYDDSFDDLMGPGNDGVCDIEGEETAAEAAAKKAALGVQLRAAAGADEYVDEPDAAAGGGSAGGSGGGVRQQQQQQQQQRGRPQKAEKLWVLDGKIYNYKKDGAQEVAGMAGAERALKAAKQAALEIHGLGPGGNVPLPAHEEEEKGGAVRAGRPGSSRGGGAGGSRPDKAGASRGAGGGSGSGAAAAAAGLPGGGRGRGQGSGRGRGSGVGDGDADGAAGAGRGRGRGSFVHKEQHKAAVANHHRKDRALSKQAKGMF